MARNLLSAGLGLARPERRDFRQNVRRGTLPSFFDTNPEAKNMFEASLGLKNRMGRQARRFATRGGYPPAGGTDTGLPPAAPTAPPVYQGGTPPPPTFGDMSRRFEVNTPPEYDTLSQYAMNSLQRTGGMDVPTYDEMFRRYEESGQNALNRQVANLKESYGSRGARYSSSLLEGEGNLSKGLFADLMKYGSDTTLGLNQQRLGELGGAASILNTVGTSRANIAESGAQRALTDYLRSTSPNPLLEAMLNYATSFDTPGQVVF